MPAEHALKVAAQSVLETMFFAGSELEAAPAAPPSVQVRVQVLFDGRRRGCLTVEMPEECARAVAASFEGIPVDEALPVQVVQSVAAELSNMICGMALASLHPDGLFRLSQPHLVEEPSESAGAAASECWLRIPSMDGLLHLILALEEAA